MFPESDWGQFSAAWRNTFVGDYEAVGAAGQVQPQGPGIEVVDSAIPEWTSNFTLDFKRGNFDAAWTLRHISELREECGNAVSFPVCSNPATGTNVLDAITYNDLQLGYRFGNGEGLGLTFGVNNVFDKTYYRAIGYDVRWGSTDTYGDPRNATLTAKYAF